MVPVMPASRKMDAIVVGLGPAGSTGARLLSQAGLSVVGIDRSEFPRFKTCGGGVSARSIPYLPIGWQSVPHEVTTGVCLTYDNHGPVEVDMGMPIAYQFRREEFDHFLLEEARKDGALIVTGVQVEEIGWDGSDFRIATEGGNLYTAPLLLAADGASSQVSRSLLNRTKKPGSFRPRFQRRSSVKHLGKSFPSSEINISGSNPVSPGLVRIDLGFVSGGYGWSFPKSRSGENIGVIGFSKPLTDPLAVLGGFVSRILPGTEGSSTREEPRTWFVPDYQESDRHGKIPGLFFLGDAGGLVDPFLGEGIYYAILSAKKAVSEILKHENHPKAASLSYAGWIRQDLFRDFAQARRLAAVIYRFPGVYFRLVQKYPHVLSLYAAILRGAHDYRSFSRSIGKNLLNLPFRTLLPRFKPNRTF